MKNIKEIQSERNRLFHDYYNNIVPERMPVDLSSYPLVIAMFKGLDLLEVQYDYGKLKDAAFGLEELVYSDVCPMMPAGWVSRPPGIYQIIDSKAFLMAENGQMQHPEVRGMNEDEYADLIKDAYAFILDVAIPRQHPGLSPEDPVMRSLRASMVKSELQRQLGASAAVVKELIDLCGYYSGAPKGSNGFSAAPFDFLADLLRGFSAICVDVRRRRFEIKDACEKLLPLMFNLGAVDNPDPEGNINMPLHMPTYLRQKDFEELWMPTYLTLTRQFAARGMRPKPFLEENWTKYLDHVKDFPSGTILRFEQGDPKEIKERLGDRFLITGLYPMSLLKTGTKEEVLSRAKELTEVMLPGCGYLFGFDKNILNASDVDLSNLLCLSEFLRDSCRFDGAGEPFGRKLNCENFEKDESIGDFDSRYRVSWEEYKRKYPYTPEFVKESIEADEISEMKFYLSLLT